MTWFKTRLEMLDMIETEIKDEPSISVNQDVAALLVEKENQLSAIYNSTAWRLIQPLRRLLEISRGTWLERLWSFVRRKFN